MNLKSIKKITDNVDGFLHDKEGELLYNLAKECRGRGVIVEIGSWKGKSTIWLGKGSQAGKRLKIYAIDPHTGSTEHKKELGKINTFKEFKRNIKKAKIEKLVIPIVKTSKSAAKDFNKLIELIFIDGDHSYEMVKLDFEMWFPKVIEGGIIAFHDTTNWPGPKKVVSHFVYKSNIFRNVNFIRSITYAKKIEKNSLKDRLRSKYILLIKSLYSNTSTLPLPNLIKSFGRKIISTIK